MADPEELPKAIESEKALLSSCLSQKDGQACACRAFELILPEDFYRTDHQRIATGIFTLLSESISISLDSILAKLGEMGLVGTNGLGAYVGQLMDFPAAIDVEYHAGLVRRAAIQRKAIFEANKLLQIVKQAPDPEEIEKKFNDALRAYSNEAKIGAGKSRFEFLHNSAVLQDLKPISWQISNVMTDRSFYYNFGDPGSWKTFVELDRLLCVASGIPYHGHPVKQGTVFYIAGEGQQGIGRRIAAWHIDHQTKAAEVPFFVAKVPTQLMDPQSLDDVRSAIDAMSKEYGPPAVVHIDTLARNFGDGDENATKDMNRVIANLDQAFGNDFCRGVTHHTGHGNKDRARGSMALHGAADIAFKVSLQNDRVLVECQKMKDAPSTPPMIFERREILLRIGDAKDRSFVLDLVAEGDEALTLAGKETNKGSVLKGAKRVAFEVLKRLQTEQDGPVHIDVFRKAAYNSGITASTEGEARKKAFQRAVSGLMDSEMIKCESGYYELNL